MKVAIIGPICRDIVTIGGKSYEQPGGVLYYTGQALASLGIDTTLFGSLGPEDHPGKSDLISAFKSKIIPIRAEATIKFENKYPDESNYDLRIQRAEIHDNMITPEHMKDHDLTGFDYIILGPLLHGNVTTELIKYLSRTTKSKLILSAQGMIRHLDGGKVVWKQPGNALSVLKHIEYVFLDEEEIRFIAQAKDLEEAGKVLHDHGAKNVIVTQGMNGSWLFPAEHINIMHKIRPYPPKPLTDPTGAGDSYMAGFVAAQDMPELAGKTAKQGLFAAMTATLSIESRGPFSGTREDVLNRLGWEHIV